MYLEYINIGMKISWTNSISEKSTSSGLVNEVWSHGNNLLLHTTLFEMAFLVVTFSTFSANRHWRKNETPLMSVP